MISSPSHLFKSLCLAKKIPAITTTKQTISGDANCCIFTATEMPCDEHIC